MHAQCTRMRRRRDYDKLLISYSTGTHRLRHFAATRLDAVQPLTMFSDDTLVSDASELCQPARGFE